MFMVSFWPREVTPPHAGLVETLLASPELASLYLSGLSFVRVRTRLQVWFLRPLKYDKQCHLPLLRLVHLHLGGLGVPHEINGMSERWDYTYPVWLN